MEIKVKLRMYRAREVLKQLRACLKIKKFCNDVVIFSLVTVKSICK